MARYFFDHRDNGEFVQDQDGLEFPDLASAQIEASRALAEHALDVVPGSERRILAIEVRGDNGLIFATRLMFEVVKMQGKSDQYGRAQS